MLASRVTAGAKSYKLGGFDHRNVLSPEVQDRAVGRAMPALKPAGQNSPLPLSSFQGWPSGFGVSLAYSRHSCLCLHCPRALFLASQDHLSSGCVCVAPFPLLLGHQSLDEDPSEPNMAVLSPEYICKDRISKSGHIRMSWGFVPVHSLLGAQHSLISGNLKSLSPQWAEEFSSIGLCSKPSP